MSGDAPQAAGDQSTDAPAEVPEVHDPRPCELGEGALWHPLLRQLFWFDIEGHALLWQEAGGPRHHAFPGPVSAAGWIDEGSLLVASDRALLRLDLASGHSEDLVALEADNPLTRSNDGRADPHGGFWIGTMGRAGEAGAGALYRYAGGELRKLRDGLTTPNALCFSPDGAWGYHADTRQRHIWRWRLDGSGWPCEAPEPFLDFMAEGLRPDGAVTDAQGNLWIAQWGAARVACHAPDGRFLRALHLPTAHGSCPCFGGADLRDLFVTTARQKLSQEQLAEQPLAGQVFRFAGVGRGRPEPRVILT
ncbi:SMP-30/gluconolactonase/LRE family protein [Pseudogemmobacter sonorensis]|uniref:SMP-30/gluconolactonase/LRE family protein n=1 Tax=Pseudogemmobacter sonorensis TaxID=2989681 RepID=UPI0036BCF8DB